MQPAKSVVLKFFTQRLHAHHAGERSIDVERFLGIALAALGLHVLERAHVVEPIRELDEEHADIGRNRDQKLAEILGLLSPLRNEVEAFDLGQAVDETADFGAEHLIDFGARRVGILDHVVQQCRRDRRVVEFQIGEDRRDFERMGKIGRARRTLLIAVRLHRVDVSAIEERLVRLRIVFENPLDEFVLPHHDPPHSFWAQA